MKKIAVFFIFILAAVAIHAQKKEGQKKFYSEPRIESITADSILEGNKFWYGPQNLHDRMDTSWCEGVAGDGIGQKVTISLRDESKVDTLFIKNGFGSPGDWLPNNRVKEMRVKGDEGTSVVTLKDTFGLQEVKLGEPVTGKTITLEILSVYKGSRDPDTCLTEIAFERKSITPCENIGKFKTLRFRVRTLSGKSDLDSFSIELSGNGILNGMMAAQRELYVNGTWSRKGNRLYLSYERDVMEGSGCGGMDPNSQGGCSINKRPGKYVIIVYNSCGIQALSGDEITEVNIEK